jgi:hypothetical protein
MYRQDARTTPSGHRRAVDQRRRAESLVLTLPSYPVSPLGTPGSIRHTAVMLSSLPPRIRPRSAHLYFLSLGSICLCIVLWMRAKTIGEDERGNAERRALFVGLWPPMFWLIGDAMRRAEEKEGQGGRRLLRARR